MTSWTLLLLTLALLGSPGRAFSSLTFGRSNAAMAHLSDTEQLFQVLAQEGLQGNLLTTREGKGIRCRVCQKMIQQLKSMVGDQPDEDTINKTASQVCSKMRSFVRGICKKAMRMSLKRISKDIMDGKTPHEVCVDIRMCKT